MNRLLLIIPLLLIGMIADAQLGYLHVKKGARKKKTYIEGENIMLRLRDGYFVSGQITLLKDDTIWINGLPVPRPEVSEVILRRKKDRKKYQVDPGKLLLITGGVALTTAGLTLSNQARFKTAIVAATAIGYGPILVQWLLSKISLTKNKYKIGKKYRLQVLDFHLPPKRGF